MAENFGIGVLCDIAFLDRCGGCGAYWLGNKLEAKSYGNGLVTCPVTNEGRGVVRCSNCGSAWGASAKLAARLAG